MKIVVCVKQVPATNEVGVDEATGVLKREGTACKVNPYDLYAVEMALALREAHGGRVQVISMGPPQAKAALLETLHMGADDACLLNDRRFAGSDVLATARTLAAGILSLGGFDLILCGMQTTDGDTAQVGPELAEFLGIEHACYVQAVQIQNASLVAELNLGNRVMVQQMPLPCLLTVEKNANTPRLPGYRRSLQVSEEQITSLSLDNLENRDESRYGLAGSPTKVERIFSPPGGTGQQLYRGTAEQVAADAYKILRQNKFV